MFPNGHGPGRNGHGPGRNGHGLGRNGHRCPAAGERTRPRSDDPSLPGRATGRWWRGCGRTGRGETLRTGKRRVPMDRKTPQRRKTSERGGRKSPFSGRRLAAEAPDRSGGTPAARKGRRAWWRPVPESRSDPDADREHRQQKEHRQGDEHQIDRRYPALRWRRVGRRDAPGIVVASGPEEQFGTVHGTGTGWGIARQRAVHCVA